MVLSASLGIAILLSIAGYIMFWTNHDSKSIDRLVYKRVSEWYKQGDSYRGSLEQLIDDANRAQLSGDSRALEETSRKADILGREISKLRVRISQAGVFENEDLDHLKNQSIQVVSYLAEAAENIQALSAIPAFLQNDFILQARRFLILADTSRVFIEMLWQQGFGVSNKKLLSRAPLIDDNSLGKWKWSERFADGLGKNLDPWPLDGVSASGAYTEAKGNAAGWVEAERSAAYAAEITASISAACAELERFARVDIRVADKAVFRRALEANILFANEVAKSAAPADSVLTFAAAWRGTRGYHEAFMSGIVADSLGELRSRWTFKAYRLAMLAGTSWNQGLEISQSRGIPFGYVPSCTGRLEILLLSPWDVRQDLTTVIPGPRAEG
ncbi:MAG: hypothetical protein C4317_02015 [Acidimicrobiia bacterium]